MLPVKFRFFNFARSFASVPKTVVELNESVRNSLEKEEYKPRKHPGREKSSTTPLPPNIITAMVRATKDYPIKTILTEGVVFDRILKGRHPPIEDEDLKSKVSEIREKYIQRKKFDFSKMDDTEKTQKQNQIRESVQRTLKRTVYNWSPIQYDQFKALQYMLIRSPAEFAVLYKIFTEIKNRDPDFRPKGFFDFGSGVGSGIWAVSNVWDKKFIFEYFLCDCSKEMNDLSELILKGGDENRQMDLKNVNYRQFLPASSDLKYNLVLSAYSLFELNSQEERLKTVKTLWDKCEDYLVLVEQGTNAGYNLILEARDLLINFDENASVFSPCPHEKRCPRQFLDDGTPCNFKVNYETTGVGAPTVNKKELYSYVVFKRRTTPKTSEEEWPRIVRPVLVRKKHSVCRMCSKNGQIEEVIFTASKHGKLTYQCARSSDWGDRLPMQISHNEAVDEEKK